jgi:Peptidase M50B-like
VTLDCCAVHEAGHVVTATLLGATVRRVRLSDHGGETYATVALRPGLLVAVAGFVGERLLLGRDADIGRARGDYVSAFERAFLIAAGEEPPRSAQVSALAALKRTEIPAMSVDDWQAMAAVAVSAARAETARLLERRGARARVLVAEAEDDVRKLLAANECVLRTVAVQLQNFGVLGGAHVLALVQEGRRRQAEDDDRKWGT